MVEYDFLISEGVAPSQINSMWFTYWDTLGIAPGQFNDRMYAWLGTIGYTGDLTDRHGKWRNGLISKPMLPQVQHSEVLEATPDRICIHWDRDMRISGHGVDAFNISIDGAPVIHPKSVHFDPHDSSILYLVLPAAVKHGQVLTWAYLDVPHITLEELAVPHTEPEFQTHTVINKVPLTFSDVVSFEAYVEDGVPDTLLAVYNDELALTNPFNAAAIIITINGTVVTTNGVGVSPVDFSNLEMTFTPNLVKGDVITFQYDARIDAGLTSVSDGLPINFAVNPVANQLA